MIIVAADVSGESRLICFRPHSHPSLLTITYWMGSGLHSPGVNMCMVGVHVSGGWASSHPLYGLLWTRMWAGSRRTHSGPELYPCSADSKLLFIFYITPYNGQDLLLALCPGSLRILLWAPKGCQGAGYMNDKCCPALSLVQRIPQLICCGVCGHHTSRVRTSPPPASALFCHGYFSFLDLGPLHLRESRSPLPAPGTPVYFSIWLCCALPGTAHLGASGIFQAAAFM